MGTKKVKQGKSEDEKGDDEKKGKKKQAIFRLSDEFDGAFRYFGSAVLFIREIKRRIDFISGEKNKHEAIVRFARR